MRKVEFPDHHDRSPNSPVAKASATKIMAIWNKENPSQKKTAVDQQVKTWFAAQALLRGWTTATFAGNECILIKSF